jgi:hypothetical protein
MFSVSLRALKPVSLSPLNRAAHRLPFSVPYYRPPSSRPDLRFAANARDLNQLETVRPIENQRLL